MANDAVRRIMAEVKELSTLNNTPTTFFHASPLETDLFEWHFSVRGPPDTPFERGVYHGRILLPPEYPLKPPEIILLTPNGRFEVGKRICLSVTAHHQETWQPSWGIRTILTALVGFMPSKAEGVGALDYPDDDRRGLARKSHLFRCPRCGVRPVDQLPPRDAAAAKPSSAASADGTAGAQQEVVSETPRAAPAESAASEQDSVDTGETRPGSEGASEETAAEVGRVASAEATEDDVITPREVAPVSVEREAEQVGRAVNAGRGAQEKELLYIAYAIVVVMVAVVARRVMKMLAE